MSQLDRQIMNVLLPKVQQDLLLSDTQAGLLVGFAFAVCYSLAGLPLARFADRGSRSGLIAVALAVWSAMTAACGLARNFVELFIARIGVGIGEAGCAPASHSLISDHFPRAHRGRALATYQLGVPIGILIGSVVGGSLSDHLAWRSVFFVFGLPGLGLALFTYFVLREPPRGGFDGQADPGVEPIGEIVRFFGRRPAMRQILVAATLHTLAVGAQVTFNFTFLTRVHDLSGTEAGIVIGLLTGLFGGLGTYLGGWLGDRFGARDPRWYLWWLALGALASIPFSLTAYLVSSAPLAIVALSISVVGSYFYTGACHVVAQSLARPRMRAITASIMLFSMNLLGYGLGPPIAGAISDALGGEDALRHALALMNAVLLWACLHYVRRATYPPQDMRRYRPSIAPIGEQATVELP
ncbi:MAG: MFS transporter [Flavobacteriaceae bacterium]|nr:MFS transporter [Flavobacteriaceae bacterium]